MCVNEKRKLKVFEAFAGIGAQAAALKRMNIEYEIVGISDWFIDAIECYAAIHCGEKEVAVPEDIAEVDEYLSKYTFSADSVKSYNIKRLTEDQRRDLYRANKKANNYGSITELHGCDMPITDLLVYSFPCQDLSTGGKGKGMSKGSGTRSGLLWEIERILKELHELGRLPEYLLLENVLTFPRWNSSYHRLRLLIFLRTREISPEFLWFSARFRGLRFFAIRDKHLFQKVSIKIINK